MLPYNPYDWYWEAADGRVYSSKRGANVPVPEDDADYKQWKWLLGVPTPWPTDDSGNQTDEALKQVLDAARAP